jgi:hypothetical protein
MVRRLRLDPGGQDVEEPWTLAEEGGRCDVLPREPGGVAGLLDGDPGPADRRGGDELGVGGELEEGGGAPELLGG